MVSIKVNRDGTLKNGSNIAGGHFIWDQSLTIAVVLRWTLVEFEGLR